MIFGIGIDIIEVQRIQQLLERFGEDFLVKNFTKEELGGFTRCADNKKVNFVAKRFAAKESFAKALGTGIGKVVGFRDVWVINDVRGKPFIKTSDKLRANLQEIVGEYVTHLSLSDSKNYAIAQVIIEKTN